MVKDIEYVSIAQCPHCEVEQYDCDEWTPEEGEHKCTSCKRVFWYKREVYYHTGATPEEQSDE